MIPFCCRPHPFQMVGNMAHSGGGGLVCLARPSLGQQSCTHHRTEYVHVYILYHSNCYNTELYSVSTQPDGVSRRHTTRRCLGDTQPDGALLCCTAAAGDWRMYVAVAAVGGFLVGLVLATCVACAVTGSKAAARAFR